MTAFLIYIDENVNIIVENTRKSTHNLCLSLFFWWS